MSILPHTIKGNGVPLVFIHAFPLSRAMWDGQSEKLSRHYRFISFDLPGFGEAPPEGDILTMETAAARVVESLDGLEIKQPVALFGLSMGGYVALQFARLFPERLRGLGLISTRSAADTPQAKEGRQAAMDTVSSKGVPALVEGMKSKLFSSSFIDKGGESLSSAVELMKAQKPEGIINALRGMRERPDSTPVLAEMPVPVWVCAGENDAVVPSTEMKAMADAAPKADFTMISQAGHLLNIEKKAEFEDAFEKYLKRRVL